MGLTRLLTGVSYRVRPVERFEGLELEQLPAGNY